jgi:hypothetical protein
MARRQNQEGAAMKAIERGRLAWLALFVPLLVMPAACVDTGYGYDGPSVGVGVDYYEPFGFDYGGWGPNYRSGPPRGGDRGFGGGRRGSPHAYRSAPSSHPMPSIPSGPRGGGRGGGGGGHGGGGGRH